MSRGGDGELAGNSQHALDASSSDRTDVDGDDEQGGTVSVEDDGVSAEENEERLRGLWNEYKETGDQALRERLILHYSRS